MQTIAAAYSRTLSRLKSHFDSREAEATTKALFEDMWALRSPRNDQNVMPAHADRALSGAIARLLSGEPLAYITGIAWFYGHVFSVDPSVLIPRPETEELVDLIIRHMSSKPVKILDVGTGSGCIAVSLAKALPKAAICAVDLSSKALERAQKNADALGVQVAFEQLDFLDQNAVLQYSNAAGPFDLIVSNPPYIAPSEKDDLKPNVRDFEPEMALFTPENDSLIFYRKLAEYSSFLVRKPVELSFNIALETSALYAAQVAQLFELNQPEIHVDMSKRPRIVTALVSLS